MGNKYIGREDAPLEEKIWEMLQKTMIESAKSVLSGRRILHVEGPYGFGVSSVHVEDYEVEPGVISSRSLPMVHIHKSFSVPKRQLAAYEDQGVMPPVKEAAQTARECAFMEDGLIFHGKKDLPGLLHTRGVNKISLSPWEQVGNAANDIIKCITKLDSMGFHGPYSLALSPERYNMLYRIYERGSMSEIEHLKSIVKEGIFKAPVLKNGGVMVCPVPHMTSITLGQDMQIGFIGPTADEMEFYISESIALNLQLPQAVCILE
ncbi:MAG: family 1 encapsulin nanocompartment shell protein [Spirochaetota bacterium]